VKLLSCQQSDEGIASLSPELDSGLTRNLLKIRRSWNKFRMTLW